MSVKGKFWDTVWRLKIRVKRIKCWFTDHGLIGADEIERFYGEADYCPECYIDWPQERDTLFTHLIAMYGWLVRRKWAWFDRLDIYLLEHHKHRLPRWWEY